MKVLIRSLLKARRTEAESMCVSSQCLAVDETASVQIIVNTACERTCILPQIDCGRCRWRDCRGWDEDRIWKRYFARRWDVTVLGRRGVSSTPVLCWATLRQPEPTSLSADLQALQLLLSSVLFTLERYRPTKVLADVVKVIALPTMHSFNYSLAN